MADDVQTIDLAAIEALRQQHIGRLLLNAHRNFSLQALTKLREHGHEGLSLAHTNLLAHLDVGGTRITSLAERVGVSKQAIGNLVGDLEAKGYIRREVDAHDRRAAVITYTAAGRKFLQDAHEVKREIEAAYIATLGEDGFQELRRLLTLLVRGIPYDTRLA
jgi:DNA-binding MarR family transcriptional regulator